MYVLRTVRLKENLIFIIAGDNKVPQNDQRNGSNPSINVDNFDNERLNKFCQSGISAEYDLEYDIGSSKELGRKKDY